MDKVDENEHNYLLRALYQGNYFDHIAIKLLSFINIDDRPREDGKTPNLNAKLTPR